MRTPGRDTSVSWEDPEPEPEVKLSWDGAYSHFNSLISTKKNEILQKQTRLEALGGWFCY